MQEIKFKADGVKVYPPTADGTIKVTFTTGEYEKFNLSDLFLMDPNKVLEVIVKVDGK